MHFFLLIILTFLFSLGFFSPHVCAEIPSTVKLRSLYHSLDPQSVSQHLALYELYPHSNEGQQALRDAYRLLCGSSLAKSEIVPALASLSQSLNGLIGMVNKDPGQQDALDLTDEELKVINRLAERLPNRCLAGYQLEDESIICNLPPLQIDLARGVLISQLGKTPEALRKIRGYEASIDLMALQILTRVSLNASPQAKIKAMNHFIFEELGFRFPPHSSHAKDIDLYTFLPSVLDSRRGVCLGVSILYICLAQRLNLELEIVTPPGHIFVRWRHQDETINIETTARGVNLPDEQYLGVDTRQLQQRTIKETIGLAHCNQAAVFLQRIEYDSAMKAYEKALKYLPDNKQLIGFIGIAAALQDDKVKAKECLSQVAGYISDEDISKDTLAEDFLNGKGDKEGIAAIFKSVDNTRESLLEKKACLEKATEHFPCFRECLFSLAGTWLQLHRSQEALTVLKKYHQIDPGNATVEYYLATLYTERFDYINAWNHFRNAEKLVKERNHRPKVLVELKRMLTKRCPE